MFADILGNYQDIWSIFKGYWKWYTIFGIQSLRITGAYYVSDLLSAICCLL